jgi:hypothetical protein
VGRPFEPVGRPFEHKSKVLWKCFGGQCTCAQKFIAALARRLEEDGGLWRGVRRPIIRESLATDQQFIA